MSQEDALHEVLKARLGERDVAAEQLDALAAQLLWRIGRLGDDGPVTVRLGMAQSAPLFADLSRLKNVTDLELSEAIDTGALRVEWVGAGLRG